VDERPEIGSTGPVNASASALDAWDTGVLRRSAIHQAGVAVILAVLNGPHYVESVEVGEDGGVVRTAWTEGEADASPDVLFNELVGRQAGYAAQSLLADSVRTFAGRSASLETAVFEQALVALRPTDRRLRRASSRGQPRGLSPDARRRWNLDQHASQSAIAEVFRWTLDIALLAADLRQTPRLDGLELQDRLEEVVGDRVER
jgi:hypothetical protein